MRKTLLAVLVSGLMVTGVQAADSQVNGYLFGNLGQADYDFGNVYTGAVGSLDEKDTAFKVGAGVQLNPFVGIEFQWTDLGETTYKEAGFKEHVSIDGYGVNLVGTLPLERFKLFGKVGYHKLEMEVEFSDDFWGSFSQSEKDWITSYGVGATFAVTPQFEIAVEYERFDDVADKFDVNVDVDFASLGLRYNF